MQTLSKAAAACLVVAAAFTGLGLLAAVPPAAVGAPQGAPDVQLRGTVTEVWVNSPGTLTFRVHGTDAKGKVATFWFKSPSDKDINTLLENLALSVIRQSIETSTELMVDAKESSGDDGTSAAKAYSFLRVGIRPQPSGSAPR